MIFLRAKWQDLIMANYEVPQHVLQPYLPKGVALDLYEGKAYLSLVGFLFKDTRLFGIPILYFGTFEEINLRFYVVKQAAGRKVRGVVFINETIPYRPVAWVANKLYKEHYSVVKTRRFSPQDSGRKSIRYEWQANGEWQHLAVTASQEKKDMATGSLEEFIFEHYAGYTRANEDVTLEYRIRHPRWKTHEVWEADICCDFATMYGNAFAFLNSVQPASVYLAEGSAVVVDWERKRI